jgi:U3 small nucleolar RNA-associated protein 3
LLKQIIEKETPELELLVNEFNQATATLNAKLRPMLDKVKAKQVDSTKHGMTYLEMKYNLLLSYCQFLSFYILLKTEGASTKDHPVIGRLLHIKTLLERLRPLD